MLAASAARAMASARASSCWLAGALPAAASAVAAAWSAIRRRTAVSVIPGRAAAACWRSKSATGRVMAVNTALLRAPASMPTATNRHSGSRQPAGFDLDGAGGDGGEHGQGEHAGQVRRGLGGGGDRGHVLAQPAGRTSTGNAGTSPAIPNGTGGSQPRPPCAVVVSASSPARWARTAGSASEWANWMPRSITRRRRAVSATRPA